MLTIQQLEIILAIEQTGSLRKAADLLYLSQPALSVTLKKMEDELGTQLFSRKSTGLEMTPICNRILPIAKNVMALIKHIEFECAVFKLLNSDIISELFITLGAYPLVATTFFPEIIVSLNNYIPNLKIYTRNISMEDSLEIIGKNEIILYVECVTKDESESSNYNSDDKKHNCRICAIHPCINMHKDYFPQIPSVIKDTEVVKLPLLTMFSANNSAANFTGQLLNHFRRIEPELNVIDCAGRSVVKAYIDAKMGVGFGMFFNEIDKIGIHISRAEGNYVSVPLEYDSNTQFYLSVKYANEIPDELIAIMKNILLDRLMI